MEQLILVNEQDVAIGIMEKMEAHEKALLHRAFSVFVFNSNGELLLQKRAIEKYHCGGLWTNTCCSHPRPLEDTLQAANRRLQEEMGFATPLKKIFDFIYKAPFSNGLTEFEFDHVFVGYHDGPVQINTAEASDYQYLSVEEIQTLLETTPDQFTPWFQIAFPKLTDWLSWQQVA